MGRSTSNANVDHSNGTVDDPWSSKMPAYLEVSSKKKWSIYMQGASALFAYHIALDEGTVTVLTPPPPERFDPFGETNYQAIEEPILKGKLGGCRVSQIDPTVTSAQEFHY